MKERLTTRKVDNLDTQFFEVTEIAFGIFKHNVRRWLLPDIAKAACSVAAIGNVVIAKYGMLNKSHRPVQAVKLVALNSCVKANCIGLK